MNISVARRLKARISVVSLLSAVMLFMLVTVSQAAGGKPIKLKGKLKSDAPAAVGVEELERLPMTGYSTYNPFVKATQSYNGVLLRELVEAYGTGEVSHLTVTAIDGYAVEFLKEEWERWDILLATRIDGKLLTVAEQGPAKIILPYDQVENIDKKKYNRKWIWMIRRIRFE